MTIICIKDGVVAADGSSWQGSILIRTDERKLCRSRDGAIGGSSGFAGDTLIFRRWFSATSTPVERQEALPKDHPLILSKESQFEGIWLDVDGEVWKIDYEGKPLGLGRGPQACGAAWQFALGAMFSGLSADDAVHLCVRFHDAAGGQVFVERLGIAKADDLA